MMMMMMMHTISGEHESHHLIIFRSLCISPVFQMHYDEILRKQEEIDALNEKVTQLQNIINVLSSGGNGSKHGQLGERSDVNYQPKSESTSTRGSPSKSPSVPKLAATAKGNKAGGGSGGSGA